MASQPSQERKLSRLESLPGELCNRIIRYAVIDSKPVLAFKWNGRARRTYVTKQPYLARVTKQIRHETLSVYYAENTFIFNESPLGMTGHTAMMNVVSRFLRSLGRYCEYITRVGSVVLVRQIIDKPGEIQWLKCVLAATLDHEKKTACYSLWPKLRGYCECEFRRLSQDSGGEIVGYSNAAQMIKIAWSTCMAGSSSSSEGRSICDRLRNPVLTCGECGGRRVEVSE